MVSFGDFLGGFSLSSILDKIYFYVGIALLAAVVGGIFFAIYYFRKKEKTGQSQKKQIIWWNEAASGDLEQRDHQKVEEVQIPGTRLRLFHDKKTGLWMPRFSREVKANCFYVLRTPTGNFVNFSLGGLSEDFKRVDKKYDHTDMLWAAENAREYIKRNYQDKAQKWWQVYQGPITTAIYILVMTFSFVIIIYFMRGIVQDIGGVAQAAQQAAELCRAPPTSGLTGAGV